MDRQTLTHDKSSHGLWPGELKRCNQKVWNKTWNIKPCIGHTLGTWELLVWIWKKKYGYIGEKALTSKSWQGPSWSRSYGSWIYNYLCNQCLSPLMLWVQISIRARCTILCDKVCQWLATGWWFPPGPPVSSTNKTDRHDITEILLKVALNTIKQTTNQNRNRTISLKSEQKGHPLWFDVFLSHITLLDCSSRLHQNNTYETGHSTAAGQRANCPSNCIFPPATLFSKMKMSMWK